MMCYYLNIQFQGQRVISDTYCLCTKSKLNDQLTNFTLENVVMNYCPSHLRSFFRNRFYEEA